MTDSLSTRNAPPPLHHYRSLSEWEMHPENVALSSNKRVATFSTPKDLRLAEKEHKALDKLLLENGAYDLLAQYNGLLGEIEKLKIQYFNMKSLWDRDESARDRLRAEYPILEQNKISVDQDISKLKRLIAPHKAKIRRAAYLKARIKAHYIALEDEKLEVQQQKLMDKEARLTWKIIREALSRIGYRHVVTRGNKRKVDLVKPERIIVTPDTIQIKVNTSRLGLLDGAVSELPFGVMASDLYKPETLNELSIATERMVYSPNLEEPEHCPPSKGVWYVVNRLGLSDGLLENVAYRDVMSRYPEDKKHLIPLPMGVKEGRYINWVFLANQPHFMVNGTTGFGKSNVMRMVLSTIIAKHSPDHIQFVILDMKNNGDFRQFEHVPHCIKSVFDVNTAYPLMLSLFEEMKRRQELIRRVTNDIEKFNRYVADVDKIPHILIVFDEYPAIHVEKELAREIDKYASQIAIQGRASGVHLFLSGQQAYSGYVPQLVTANITNRFTARQTSVGASMSTVGDRSALRMRALPGRFLCTTEGDRNFQVQMPYIEDYEIQDSVSASLQWENASKVVLPSVDIPQAESSGSISIVPQKSYKELILETAMEMLDGNLKGQEIYELLEGKVPQKKVFAIIKEMVAEPIIYHEITYKAVRVPGGSYTLKIQPVAAAD